MAKKTIAIIGATEKMGAAIARNLSSGNYRLLLFSHDSEKSAELLADIRKIAPAADIELLSCLVDASWEADIIISAVASGAEPEIAEKIREVAIQKVVMIITDSESRAEVRNTTGNSAAEEFQRLLPHSKVVKTFNSLAAADFARAVADGKSIDSFIAGNDKEAVKTVTEIITTAGYHPIIAGELATSRALENSRLI